MKNFLKSVSRIERLEVLARFAPLSHDSIFMLEEFCGKYIWESLSRNSTVDWFFSDYSKYDESLNLNQIVLSEKIFFDWNFFDKYASRINKKIFSATKKFHWDEDFIEKYKDELDWIELCGNKSICWTSNMIDRYEDKINWSVLSSNENGFIDEDFFYKYIEKIDINKVLINPSFFITEDMFHRMLPRHGRAFCFNPNLPWSIDFFEKYLDNFDFAVISGNKGMEWNEEFVEKYKSEWHWGMMSRNESLPWSDEFLGRYESLWSFLVLEGNTRVPWSEKNIIKYKDRIKSGLPLALNPNAQWSFFAIDQVMRKHKICYHAVGNSNINFKCFSSDVTEELIKFSTSFY